MDGNGTLTNAGALLADNGPVYQSRLFCTRWNGLTKASGLNYTALDKGERTGKEPGKKTGKENRERILQSKEIMGTILSLLKDNPQMTIVMVAEATGLSNKQAERCMEKLKKEGHLIREGSTKAGSWIVIDE